MKINTIKRRNENTPSGEKQGEEQDGIHDP